MIEKEDKIVTAFAESASGPGWANQPVWIIVRDKLGNLREECLQPEEQTETMQAIYKISQAVHQVMKHEVEINQRKGKR